MRKDVIGSYERYTKEIQGWKDRLSRFNFDNLKEHEIKDLALMLESISAKYQKLAENREESQQDENHGGASTRKAFKRY